MDGSNSIHIVESITRILASPISSGRLENTWLPKDILYAIYYIVQTGFWSLPKGLVNPGPLYLRRHNFIIVRGVPGTDLAQNL